jgi:hypothetical protein
MQAVSTEHCNISYSIEKGWTISELNKSKSSLNGTYVFLKSFHQLKSRIPSDMILLTEDTTISFVNYDLKVSFVDKTYISPTKMFIEQKSYYCDEIIEQSMPDLAKS